MGFAHRLAAFPLGLIFHSNEAAISSNGIVTLALGRSLSTSIAPALLPAGGQVLTLLVQSPGTRSNADIKP